MPFTHYAFSDDSVHTDGRYNSLAMVTVRRDDYQCIIDSLDDIFSESHVKEEFKWQKLRNAKYRFVAEKIVDFTFRNSDKIRVDVITWDLEDRRHKGIKGRDDSENLVRMYYHLSASTLSRRWQISNSCWKWNPDEQSSVCWDTLRDCLRTKKHACIADLFDQNPEFEQVDLRQVTPSESHDYPLIQVADLFAGMGAYSFGHFEQYQSWYTEDDNQLSIFEEEKQEFTNSELERSKIIDKFNSMAKNNKLQIALESSKGFNSYNPDNFVNFWLYVPQHLGDKAPVKYVS